MNVANTNELAERTSEIVAAYVANNSVQLADMPALISSVHAALGSLGQDRTTPAPAAELKPAVPIKKSVMDDYIISLEDGRKFKSLKRHLRAEYGMTPDEYRVKWGLPKDYPMVAPSYAKTRSALAKTLGLGRKPSVAVTASEPEPVNEADPELAKNLVGRRKPRRRDAQS